MPEAAHPLTLPPETHRNHYLFSDHYLNELLPRQAVWREVEAEARQALEAITARYRQVADALSHYNETAVEQEWIRPVLDILGHVYHVQPSLPDAAGTPDYAFFADQAAKSAAASRLGTAAFWETALAVGDAKRWDRPLDRRILDSAPDAFTNANPCYQIDCYLRRTGCTWGLVSNGRRWRLYHRDSSYRLDVFYEMDLAQRIEQGDADAFRYFYLFFRADAFRPNAEGPVLSEAKGRCWLDTVLAESTAYAVRVGDELTDRVHEALRLLAQGFLDCPQPPLRRRRPEPCPEPCRRVAEGLQTAPEVRRALTDEDALDTEATAEPWQGFDLPRIHDACLILLYRLLFLFYAESRGLLPLDNPSYREQYSLKAIKEDVARKLDAGAAFLPRRATLWDDLKTLFGIIYQGNQALGVPAYNSSLFDPAQHPFLEEHTIGDRYLAQAIDLLARVEAGQGQGLSFVDYRDLSIRSLGSIYEGLLDYRLQITDWRSEIADGEWRVELVTERGERKATGSYYTPHYVVKYIVEQTLGPLADAQAEAVEKEIAAFKARNRGAARRTRAYKDELARLQNSLAERILSLNVLDPAMGSGHFLVEATDYLARRIVEAGVASEALVNDDEESELSYWRRRVVERCIYGVDLNPLAVELAKLSLGLSTAAKGKPLSFPDHHLRCGNALIGAEKTLRVSETLRVSDPVERRKGRAIADLWTAGYFGLELTPELYNACVQHAQGKPVLWQAAQAEALLAQAQQIREDKRFFHWEIEFPEIFFDPHGQPKGGTAGFDAVVGNPPWISFGLRGVGKLDKQEETFYRRVYQDSAEYKLSIYVLFMELALTLLRVGGRHSYIVPDSFLLGQYFSKIRSLILRTSVVDQIVFILEDFWPAGSVGRSVVYVLQSAKPGENKSEKKVRVIRADTLQSFSQGQTVENRYGQGVFERAHLHRFRLFFDDTARRIVEKMESGPELLGDVTKFYSGLIGKAGKASIVIKGQPPDYSPDRYGRLIESGANLDRYSLLFTDHYIRREKRLYKSGYDVQKYLNPKIFMNQTGDRLKACFDAEGYFCLNNMHIGYPVADHYDLRYINALLCSRLLGFYYHSIGLESGRAMAQVDIEMVDRLPIRRIEFTTPVGERARLAEERLKHEEGEMARMTRNAQGTFVPFTNFRAFRDSDLGRWLDARLSAEPEQADVVHDLLARLVEWMIEMHREKQAEVKGFLDWLADYTGRPVDDWILKTYLRQYYEHDWAEMQRILKRNQRKLPNVDLDVDAYRNEPARKIKGAWETSMETLRPLLKDIEATDRLIDRIVYPLYGLTEEEITLVEREWNPY